MVASTTRTELSLAVRNLKLLVFFLCKIAGLFHLAQWITRDRLRILCYHGFALADEAKFRPKLFITAKQFEQRLATVRRYRLNVLPLDEAIDHLYSHSLPDNSASITIDDGFHSVHRLAVPCLRAQGFPATVYVTTYYVANPHPIFRLVVQYMFWKTRKRRLLRIQAPWTTRESIDLSDAAEKEQAVWDCINFGERECTEEMRHAICEQLGTLLETPYEDIKQHKLLHLMNPDELRTLADANIGIELHTHRHTFPSNNQSLAEREITDNRAALQRWIATEGRHFCYPSGLWDKRQWVWLDNLGIKSSTTCMPGLNSPKTPRHALRRFLDSEDVHQLEFEAAITGFTDLLRHGWSSDSA